jgi:ribosome biogenesis GTPase
MSYEKIKNLKLEDLGYNDFFKSSSNSIEYTNFVPARVIAEHKKTYILRNETSELTAKITGKLKFDASSREDYPTVGDWVMISILDNNCARIHKVLPRKTVLKRKSSGKSDVQLIASNIDTAFIIQSPDRDYNLNRIERYLSLANSEKVKPVIVLNKIDLIPETELDSKLMELKNRFRDTEILATSTIADKGIHELSSGITKGLTYCFIGSSGVGKSSIINMLLEQNIMKTSNISSHSDRGIHITTHRHLFILKNSGLLLDTPGMREIGLLDSDMGIENVFTEIVHLSKKCKFSNCTHTHEPGCAVQSSIKSGELEEDKYSNFVKLKKENEHHNMTNLEKKNKDKKFGKFQIKTRNSENSKNR